MKKCLFCLLGFAVILNSFAQKPLLIPDTISGTNFNLTIQKDTTVFFTGYKTPTWGFNGSFLGPTLIMKKGDNININVTNNLTVTTTVHWHGFHIPAIYDGGPHQTIKKNTTWNPKFKMLNDAGTFWYHPHGNGTTELHVTKGLAGMIIVRDSIEATYAIPRKYGIDDFPLIVQSKSFDVLHQLAAFTATDSTVMVNGTIDPYLAVPKQIVRFRLLNGSADRTFNFGMEDSSTFNLIATDGGMLSKPEPMKRLRLSPGERAEILIDFSVYTLAQSIYLKSYASELPKGIIGADSVGTTAYSIPDYYTNPLNGSDFSVIRFDISNATLNPVTSIPVSFTALNPYVASQAVKTRSIHFSPDSTFGGAASIVEGPFFMNGKSFNMDTINEVVYLNDIEIWQLTNATMVAHPFHIHDIEFYVLDINGKKPPVFLNGKKDVILVQPNDTVRFITKFDDFANDTIAYMYHCHLLHHEDEGMMGSFVVIDTTSSVGVEKSTVANTSVTIYPNPSTGLVVLNINTPDAKSLKVEVLNILGEKISVANERKLTDGRITLNLSDKVSGTYFVHIYNGAEMVVKKIVITK